MNQSINTDSKNNKEPQQKYRLGTVSIKILGGLNRFYGRPTSPSASIMAQNIQSISTQFVKIHFLNYPIFMSKTTLLLKQMTEETDLCRNKYMYSSCMTVVAMGQNVKTYPTTQCKFLLILKMGVPVFICASCMQ